MWLSPVLNHLHNAPGSFSPEEETEEKEWKRLTPCHSATLGCQGEETPETLLPGQRLRQLSAQSRRGQSWASATPRTHPCPRSSPEKLVSTPGGLCTTGLQDRDVSTIAAIISSISTASDFLDSDRWEPKVTSLHSWSREHLTFLDCPLHASTPVSQCVLK